MAEVFAKSEDHDQMPHSTASDQGLHCLPVTLLGVSRLQWVKGKNLFPICSLVANSLILDQTLLRRGLVAGTEKQSHKSCLPC